MGALSLAPLPFAPWGRFPRFSFRHPKQGSPVRQIDRQKFATVERRPVVEHAGQLLRRLQAVHITQGQRLPRFLAIFPQLFNGLRDKRTLIVVVDRQLPFFNFHFKYVGREPGIGSVKGKSQQFVTV